MAALAEGLRRIVQAAVPDALERVRSGWRVIGYDVSVGRRTAYFAWVMPERAHVHLGFPKGVLLDDPDGILEGRGITKAARWFTLQVPDDLLDERLGLFARSAADLARLTASAPASCRRSEKAVREGSSRLATRAFRSRPRSSSRFSPRARPRSPPSATWREPSSRATGRGRGSFTSLPESIPRSPRRS
jgi:hypothetical protein